jgi:Uncharacterized conserved protein
MKVAVVKAKDSIYQSVKEAIDFLGGIDGYILPGERVLIKPNLCTKRRSDSGATTDGRIVDAIIKLTKEAGADPEIMESAIYPNDTEQIFDFLGYKDLGVVLHNVDTMVPQEYKIVNPLKLAHVPLPRDFFQHDKLINVPKLKTHLMTTASLGMKNVKGLVPGKQKHLAHMVGLDSAIVDLNKLIRSDLVVVDGIVGMEGAMGPTWGSPVDSGVIIAGDNVVATDVVCCHLMGINPKSVRHLVLASKNGLGAMDLDKIELFGEPLDKVSRKFDHPKHATLYSRIGDSFLYGLHSLRNPIARLMHLETVDKKPIKGEIEVDETKCNLCKVCQKACPKGAIKVDGKVLIDKKKCILCGCCIEACPQGAICLKR